MLAQEELDGLAASPFAVQSAVQDDRLGDLIPDGEDRAGQPFVNDAAPLAEKQFEIAHVAPIAPGLGMVWTTFHLKPLVLKKAAYLISLIINSVFIDIWS